MHKLFWILFEKKWVKRLRAKKLQIRNEKHLRNKINFDKYNRFENKKIFRNGGCDTIQTALLARYDGKANAS